MCWCLWVCMNAWLESNRFVYFFSSTAAFALARLFMVTQVEREGVTCFNLIHWDDENDDNDEENDTMAWQFMCNDLRWWLCCRCLLAKQRRSALVLIKINKAINDEKIEFVLFAILIQSWICLCYVKLTPQLNKIKKHKKGKNSYQSLQKMLIGIGKSD